ncbi:DNA-3-methyladenine glycosylase [Foetidibacter luteolus]|uniref:DNA-3-methyladenine glycosylase n=1 Tax=Foetidibacter luteolus TaxID=2608880 RepID=UPI001F3B70D8|nr:DNA-3-methyladenine glycosylase [Foetidibacter luteolus]
MKGFTHLNNSISGWQILNQSFYQRGSVLQIAKDLLGKLLVTTFNGQLTAARIVETEAYNGVVDKASHAYNGRRTARTEIMYAPGGTAYVYLCYGIHHLFNVVTNIENIPHAVLIRAAEPVEGETVMLQRMGRQKADFSITRGPGNVSRALGIATKHTGLSLLEGDIFIADDGFVIKKAEILATPRIGVDYAGADSALPYRFIIQGNPYVSGKKVKLAAPYK